MRTLTYNCPCCKNGFLQLTEIRTVELLEPNKANIFGVVKCDYCEEEYYLTAKDVTIK